MASLHLDRLMEFLAGIEPAMAVFWTGLAIFTVGLAVLMYTRWGQYKPLRKCMGLSILAHLIMACYAATIHIAAPLPQPPEQFFQVSMNDGEDGKTSGNSGNSGPLLPLHSKDQPWEAIPNEAATQPEDTKSERQPTGPLEEPKRLVRADDTHIPGDPALDETARWVVGVPKAHLEPFVPRVTLTLPTLGSCREMLFEVAGSDKRAILTRLFNGENLPANRARSSDGKTVWLVDRAARPEGFRNS